MTVVCALLELNGGLHDGRGGSRSHRDRRSPLPSGLLVRNLPLDARPKDLRDPFERFGPVKDVYLPKNYWASGRRRPRSRSRTPRRRYHSHSRSPSPARMIQDFGNISFPFTDTQHPDCGILIIHGCDDPELGITKSIKNNNKWFDVVKIEDNAITITDNDLRQLLMTKSCDVFNYDSTFIVSSPFASSQTDFYSNLLTCNHTLDPQNYNFAYKSTLRGNDTLYDIGRANKRFIGCSMVQLPVSYDRNYSDLFVVITSDVQFEIDLTPDCLHCHNVHEGQCRVDSSGKFYCDKRTCLIISKT
ncbi:unnamed protein product [Lupinus luteus]|uniref:RRM domain-containing protein n=1 Tax=Lupinus luteus TaxID=3873 RepID=A0AAV1WC16_LUPLU